MIKEEYIKFIYIRNYRFGQTLKSVIRGFERDIEIYRQDPTRFIRYHYGPDGWREIVDSFKQYLVE